ncbi:hydroxyacid dehydrogenase [uncultured Megasphaera sp.]|uniref:hydroxyacid dehydrogenase n=1 Tax=uncultured Megasphaera sp. TaxID=165188 RepID=UPI002625BBC5|nr:hydroxyacid dehydrogenase [uncultured Megasphaera sp.]
MKTYIFDPISDEALAYAKQYLDVVAWDDPAIQNAADAEAVIVRTYVMDKEKIDAMPKLRIIAKHGVGTDNIDIPYAASKGILVTNTPTANSNSVAELIIGLILDCARKITYSHESCMEGLERNQPMFLSGQEISGKKAGLIGIGHIGAIVGKRLKGGFDMDVLAYDPFLGKEKTEAMGFSYTDDVTDIYKTCDVVSVSVPLNDQTRNMISAGELAMCKKNAIIINASRGGIVNEHDLSQALADGEIFSAAVDAWVVEPVQKDHELFRQKNFVGTPHNGANTKEALINMGTGAVDEILRVARDEPTLTNLGLRVK